MRTRAAKQTLARNNRAQNGGVIEIASQKEQVLNGASPSGKRVTLATDVC
jgi:hypothetical protein